MTIDRGSGDTDDARLSLADYEERSSFLFASARGTVLTRGVEAIVPKVVRRSALSAHVRDFLAGAQRFGRSPAMVVGAIPFEDRLPAHLMLPGEAGRSASSASASLSQVSPAYQAVVGRVRVRLCPTPGEYRRNVARSVRRIADGEFDVLNLARCVQIATGARVSVRAVLHAMHDDQMFAVPLPCRGEDGPRGTCGPQPALRRTLIGRGTAVVERSGSRVRYVAREGPLPDALSRLCRKHQVVRGAGRLEFTGEIADADMSALDIALALHPAAELSEGERRAVSEAEPFHRGYACGVVGWCDAAGDGEWSLAKDCVEVQDRTLRLLASADVTEESDPSCVLSETSHHLRAQLSRLGMAE